MSKSHMVYALSSAALAGGTEESWMFHDVPAVGFKASEDEVGVEDAPSLILAARAPGNVSQRRIRCRDTILGSSAGAITMGLSCPAFPAWPQSSIMQYLLYEGNNHHVSSSASRNSSAHCSILFHRAVSGRGGGAAAASRPHSNHFFPSISLTADPTIIKTNNGAMVLQGASTVMTRVHQKKPTVISQNQSRNNK